MISFAAKCPKNLVPAGTATSKHVTIVYFSLKCIIADVIIS